MSTRSGGPSKTTKSVSGVKAVVLVGFMGAGKSSVGAALSRRLGWPFEDLDERIQAREQPSIEEIFRLSGEAVFRRLEHEALRSLISETGIVEMRIGETKIGDMKTGEMKTDKPGPSAKV